MKAEEKAEKLWQLFDLCRELRLDVKAIQRIVDKRVAADALGENLYPPTLPQRQPHQMG